MRLLTAISLIPFSFCALAQQSAPASASPPPPAPPVVHSPPASYLQPKVNPDRSVSFRYTDPDARSVALDLEGVATPIPLVKGEGGVWTLTTEPLAPEIYGYHFTVDGRFVLDPRNNHVKASLLAPSNGFLVPGASPEPWEITNVPHGEVHRHIYTTAIVTGLERNQSAYYVYTPPGYDPRATTRYPVLYLLHGYTDTDAGWTETGFANLILDNLIAAGRVKPMIVVMPLCYGQLSFIRQGFGVWEKKPLVDQNTEAFERALLTEVLPAVERQYNVSPRREDRAIAGLSMGGLEALTIGITHSDQFAYVGGFSAAVHLLGPEGLPGMAGLSAEPKNALKLLWVSCGTSDDLIKPNRRLVAELQADGFKVTPVETPGMHTWLVWRDNLVNFAPLLFK
jgi:enterochelin esterase family protein